MGKRVRDIKPGTISLKNEEDRNLLLRNTSTSFSPEDKIKVVSAYLMTGSAAETGRMLGIEPAVIRGWKCRAPWWDTVVTQIKNEKLAEFDSVLSQIRDEAWKQVKERLENGDEVITRNGKETLKVRAKDAAIIAVQASQLLNLIRGDATARTETVSRESTLDKLASRFEKMVLEQEAKTIPGEVLEDEG